MKSYYWADRDHCNLHIEPNSLLLLGQTDVDLSLIKDNKLVCFLDYADALMELCSRYERVYYKPHPYASPNNGNEKFVRNISNVCVIDTNFYRLMLEENIVATAALSSGTLTEAKYFRKESHYISHQFVNYCFDENPMESDFVLVKDEYYSPVFWKDILSPIIETLECKPFSWQNKANTGRNSLDTGWGYEITTSEIRDLKHELMRSRAAIADLSKAAIKKHSSFFRKMLGMFRFAKDAE